MNIKQIQQMMKQAQKMQSDLKSIQEELEQKEYQVSSGGGAVEVKMTGDKKLVSINIKEEVIDPDDKEMLEDMIALAINNAIDEITKESEEKLGSVTGGLPF